MKKVLFVLEASLGGTGKHVLDVIENIDRDLFDPVLVCSLVRADAVFLERLKKIKTNTSVICLPMMRRPCLIVDVIHLIKLFLIIKRGQFDIVHTHSAKAGFLGRLAAKMAGSKTILYTPHAFSFFATPYKVLRYLYILLERFAGKFTTTLIAVSLEEKEVALRHRLISKDRIEIIYNGIEAGKYGINSRREVLRNTFGVLRDECVVGFIGRRGVQKDIGTLFRAIELVLKEKITSFRFLCLGISSQEGEVLTKGMNIYSGRIIFLGVQSDVPGLLSACDMFVSCARYEGFAYAPLEAMATRLPVILTEEGNNGAITDKKEGLLFKAGDAKELANMMLYLSRDPVMRLRLGLAGRARVEKNFSLHVMLGQLMDIYKR